MNNVEHVREIYWNISGHVPFVQTFLYLLAIASLGALSYGIWRDVRRWRLGRPARRDGGLWLRTGDFLQQVFGQKKVLRDRIPGIMHTMIFYGFLALFIGTDIIAAEEDFTIPTLGADRGRIITGGFYTVYEFVLDTLGLLFVVGLIWAAYRRYVRKPDRLDNRNTDWWVLGTLLFIGIGGYLIEGLRILNQTMGPTEARVFTQAWARWNVVGYPLAVAFRALGLEGNAGLIAHRVLWVPHMIATFAFVGSIPYTKFRHIFYTPLNGFFRDLEPKGALKPIEDIENKEESELGINTLAEMTWKQRASLDACMRCGRCQSKCPAYASGSDLSPKWLITKMDDLMRGAPVVMRDGTIVHLTSEDPIASADRTATEAVQEGHQGELPGLNRLRGGTQFIKADRETIPLYGNLISENELWSCTTCRACVDECPAMIEHVDDIVDMRRKLALVEGEVPSGVQSVLQGIERNGNPWKLPQRDRAAWTEGLDVPLLAEKEQVDVLYWVGCAPSYDARSRKTARALVQLMQQAGVDFAILGEEETCTGDPARRMGEEFLYQEQAKTNIETFGQYKFKRVVTTCAHCFNTIRNEYPQFGGNYEVIHHTQFLAGLVKQGKLNPTERVDERVVYHDPCYIGRYNDIYDDPRDLLRSIPGVDLAEAPDWNREKAMCCGGGGGNVWMEGWGKKGINVIRLEQIQKAKPDTLAMGCPFCMVMFNDAATNTGVGDTLNRKDVAELLLQSVTPPTT